MGFIYILTNESISDYVKIGYAKDVEKRVAELNRSECIPLAFRIYATYEVPTEFSDKRVHTIIDKLNPSLRSIDNLNDKERKREFYALKPEEAYAILQAMAEIHDTADKLKLYVPIPQEIESEKRNEFISLEQYLATKNKNIVHLYETLQHDIYDTLSGVEITVINQYIAWKRGKQFAQLSLQTNNIKINTLCPVQPASIGEILPDTYGKVLNYVMYINENSDLAEVKHVIIDSYNQRSV